MKIIEATKIEIVHFLIETDIEYPNGYKWTNEFTRYSADNWTERMGESDETVYYCEDLETLYQKWLKEQLSK